RTSFRSYGPESRSSTACSTRRRVAARARGPPEPALPKRSRPAVGRFWRFWGWIALKPTFEGVWPSGQEESRRVLASGQSTVPPRRPEPPRSPPPRAPSVAKSTRAQRGASPLGGCVRSAFVGGVVQRRQHEERVAAAPCALGDPHGRDRSHVVEPAV